MLREYYERESLGDGRYSHVQHLTPIAYPDSGGWLRNVSDWADGDMDRPHLVTRAGFWVGVAPDGRRRFYPTKELGRYFEIGAPLYLDGTWKSPELGTPTRSGATLTWTKAAAHMTMTHGGHFVDQDIWLDAPAFRPTQWALPLDLVGFTYSNGRILDNGVPVMRIRPFVLRDGADPEFIRAIPWTFENQGGQWYVVLTPDYSGATLPIIDPTLTLQPGAATGYDSFLDKFSPAVNRGTSAALAFTYDSAATANHPVIKFDLSGLPVGATIVSATLSLWVRFAMTFGTSNNRVHRILDANSGWTELGSTWNTIEGATPWAGSAGCSTDGTDRSATTMAQTDTTLADAVGDEIQFALNLTEFGLMVASNNGMVFYVTALVAPWQADSSDSASAGERPKLVVVYSVPGALAGSGPRARGRGRGR